MSKWQWFGQARHFIAADRCRFHLHTHIDARRVSGAAIRTWCVSTVGEYFPLGETEQHEIGCGRTYETMVFLVGPDGETGGDPVVVRGYTLRALANAGHIEVCRQIESGEF